MTSIDDTIRNDCSDSRKVDKYEKFEIWLRDNGAKFEALELREYETAEASGEEDDLHNGSSEEETAEEKKEPPSFKSTTPSKVSPEEESEIRGVHAKENIPPNTICMSVPRKCLITVEMGQATEIGQAILHSDLELDAPKHIFLMVYLLWDRKQNGSKSFFAPYYDVLPKTLSNMPIFWSEQDLSYLEGSYLLAQIADRNDAIEEDYHAICEVAPELADIATLEEFKWARMCVCSRNFGLQIDGNRTSALVPHADMLNHYRPRETKWTFDDDRQAFTITTLQTIPCGAQVYDSYGQKCNHRFLLNYGFAVEDNREIDGFCPNEVPIELGILPNDPLFDAKYEFWTRGESSHHHHHSTSHAMANVAALFESPAATARQNHPPDPHTSSSLKRIRVCISNNENTRILFSMLRVIVADESELHAIVSTTHPFGAAANSRASNSALTQAVLGFSSSNPNPSPPSSAFYRTCRDVRCPISFKNEQQAMHHLLDVTRKALCIYPTTYEQDVQHLADQRAYPRFTNKRHAKIQVRGEKEVLLHFHNWASTALDVMDIIDKEINATTTNSLPDPQIVSYEDTIRAMEEAENNTIHHTIIRYCVDVLGALRREERKRRKKIHNLYHAAALSNSTTTAIVPKPASTTSTNSTHGRYI